MCSSLLGTNDQFLLNKFNDNTESLQSSSLNLLCPFKLSAAPSLESRALQSVSPQA